MFKTNRLRLIIKVSKELRCFLGVSVELIDSSRLLVFFRFGFNIEFVIFGFGVFVILGYIRAVLGAWRVLEARGLG